MSQANIYSGSTTSTPSDDLYDSIHDGSDDTQHGQLPDGDDVSHQMHVHSDTQSNSIDMISISQKSDEVRKKNLSRWDDCLTKKSQIQQNSSPDQKIISHSSLNKTVIQEFLPRTDRDPILPTLRELFVRSFDEFYKEIEAQLKLKTNKALIEWLQETFDEMQDDMLTRKCRCFMLCSSDGTVKNGGKQNIVGFLTLKEEENGSVYIAQCAIEAENKRRGNGGRLLQHLRTIYPSGTFYWGLCRRANGPAVKFYLKQGAKFMDDEEVATKYGYDPTLYTGFHFSDNIGNFQSSASEFDASTLQSASFTSVPTSEPVLTRRSNVTYQHNSTMTDPLLDVKKRPLHKRISCCVIS